MKPGTLIKIKPNLELESTILKICRHSSTGAEERLISIFKEVQGIGKIITNSNTFTPSMGIRIKFGKENEDIGFWYYKKDIIKYFYFHNEKIETILYD